MTSQNLTGLELIEGQQIRQLAAKGDVTHQYVYQIVTGRRKINSAKAKAIYAAAKVLNKTLESGLLKAEKQLQTTDND